MITQGPFDLTLGTTLPLSDPGANSNNPATAVQLQNASPFIIEVNSGGTLLTIQAFTAQTISTSGGGQQMSVAPLASGARSQVAAVASLSAVWLLAGESSPMVDGSLTAAALTSSLSSAGLAGASTGVKGFAISVASGATSTFTLPAGTVQLWNIGWQVPFGGTIPTLGIATFTFHGSSFNGAIDSVSLASPASDRLAGIYVDTSTEPTVQNNFDQTISAFIVFSGP